MKSGYYERFLNLCRHHKIKLWNIKISGSRLTFSISIKDYKRLVKIARKTKTVPHILERRGRPFVVFRGKKNWTFIAAALIFLIMLQIYSGFIWSIEIIGQREYTKEEILEAIRQVNIYPGMRKSDLNCDDIETFLRKKYERLSWVSAEEVGSRLIIKVKEGTKTLGYGLKEQPMHLIADCDGVIADLIVAKGTPVVKAGQKVKKGDILIQGIVEIKDDSQIVVERLPVQAKGTVKIETTINREKKYPLFYQKKNYTGETQVRYLFQTGKKRLGIKNPLKQFDKSAKYDIINEVCYTNSNHLFGLDVVLYRQTCRVYQEEKCFYDEKQMKRKASYDVNSLLKEYEKKGCTILDKQALLWKQKKDWLLRTSVHMIVPQKTTREVRQEEWSVENGTDHGNSDGT